MASTASGWSGAATSYSSVAAVPAGVAKEATRLLLEGRKAGEELSFIDVAAGPATLALEVLKQLEPDAKGRIAVTDFAPGMIDAAKGRIEAARAAGEIPAGVSIDCSVADGCELKAFADGSFQFVGCAFGIMFYTDLGKGLRELRRVTAPGGRAVVTAWRQAGAADLVNDFAAFLGLPPPDASNPASPAATAQRIISVGKDSEVLAADLKAAGFSTVAVHPVSVTFVTHDVASFLTVVLNNPAMKLPLAAAPADTDFPARWAAFFEGDAGSKWALTDADGKRCLTVPFVANVALATTTANEA